MYTVKRLLTGKHGVLWAVVNTYYNTIVRDSTTQEQELYTDKDSALARAAWYNQGGN